MFAKTLGSKITVCAALVLGALSTAHAVPYTWTDFNDEDFGDLIDKDHTVKYTHNIKDPSSGGYRPGIDTITSASLTIKLFDDALFGDSNLDLGLITDPSETVGFRFDNGSWVSQDIHGDGEVGGNIVDWDNFDFIVTSLLNDGLLSVEIRANQIGTGRNKRWGDFVFGSSYLTASGNRAGGTSVPEPATLSLFGLGLLGLGFAARRRKV